MTTENNVILIFTQASGLDIVQADTPGLGQLKRKGTLLFNDPCREHDHKTELITVAGSGASRGQLLWEAAAEQGFRIGGLEEECDVCVLETGSAVEETETMVVNALAVGDQHTIIVLVAPEVLIFYGPGLGKGVVVDKPFCPAVVAPTVAYVANLPLPAHCEAPVAYAALEDMNFKLNEIRKLKEAIHTMEAAMEGKGR